MKNLCFLFEANKKIGGGHFWRCLNLALKLKKKKLFNIFFLSNFQKSFFFNHIKDNKIKYLKEKNLYNLNTYKKIFKKFKIDILIADTYKLDLSLQKKIKKLVKKLIIIDDNVNKKYKSDILINNNFLNKKDKLKIKKKNPHIKLYLGPRYLLLNNNFKNIRKIIKVRKKIKKIFIFFGTSDTSNETKKILNLAKNYKNFYFFVLLGSLNKNAKRIKKRFSKNKNIKLLFNLRNDVLKKYFIESDLSVGSGGISLLERLFFGIPSIVITTAKNQENSVNYLKKKKLIYSFGNFKRVKYEKVFNFIKKLNNSDKNFLKFSKKTFSLFESRNDLNYLSNRLSNFINIYNK